MNENEKEKEKIFEEVFGGVIKEARLSAVSKAVDNYVNDIFVRTSTIMVVSLICLLKTPLDTLSILKPVLPAPAFYIMTAVAMVSVIVYGVLGFIKGRPLLDIGQAIENDNDTEAKAIAEDMIKGNKWIDFISNILFALFLIFSVAPSLIGYHTECPNCHTDITVNSEACDECGVKTADYFDKDIVQYISNTLL